MATQTRNLEAQRGLSISLAEVAKIFTFFLAVVVVLATFNPLLPTLDN